MKKKITVTILMLFLFIPNVAFAKTFNYWYSDSNRIGFLTSRNIWSNNLSGGFSYSDFSSYYNHAVSQWRAAGIPTYGSNSKNNASIHWYAGKRSDLEALEPDLTYYAALSDVYFQAYSTDSYKNLKTIYNKRITQSKIYTPKGTIGTAKRYRTMFTHELGHSLGYFNHSTSKNDLMHGSGGTDTLTNRDKNHLNQNY